MAGTNCNAHRKHRLCTHVKVAKDVNDAWLHGPLQVKGELAHKQVDAANSYHRRVPAQHR
jgi:hypothetical protein